MQHDHRKRFAVAQVVIQPHATVRAATDFAMPRAQRFSDARVLV